MAHLYPLAADIMRIAALLCLILALLAPALANGQTFNHNIFAIVCCITAGVLGFRSTKTDRVTKAGRRAGQIIALLGLVLAVYLATQLPSTQRAQNNFNRMSRTGEGAK